LKKFFALFICLITVLSFASCRQQEVKTYTPDKAVWLPSGAAIESIPADFKETCTYSVKLVAGDDVNKNVAANYDTTRSTLTTTIETVKYPDENGQLHYLYTTTYDMYGSYTAKEGSVEFHDVTVNKTYFTWSGGIVPVYSEQTVQSTVPTLANGKKDEHGNVFSSLNYKVSITYGEEAETKFEILGTDEEKAKNAPYYSLKNGHTSTIKRYNKNNYVDVNTLFLFPRCFGQYSAELSYYFSTVDVMGNALHSMSLIADSTVAADTSFITTSDGMGLGASTDSCIMEITLNETYTGSSITCQYLNNVSSAHNYLYELTTALPYNMGSLVYTLSSVTR